MIAPSGRTIEAMGVLSDAALQRGDRLRPFWPLDTLEVGYAARRVSAMTLGGGR